VVQRRSTSARLAVCCLSVVLASAAWAQTTDLIDTAALGQRGVVFETSALGEGALSQIMGADDFNGIADAYRDDPPGE
jgi:hypothetical protein